MPINYPNAPADNDPYEYGGVQYIYKDAGDGKGYWKVNNTGSAAPALVAGTGSSQGRNNSQNDSRFLRLDQTGTVTGNLTVDGNITATGEITQSSDRRLKINPVSIPNALEKVCAVSGYIYERIDKKNKKETGVIAQEILEILPEAVAGGPTEDNPEGFYSVAYSKLVGLLIEAIKEQQVTIIDMQDDIAALQKGN